VPINALKKKIGNIIKEIETARLLFSLLKPGSNISIIFTLIIIIIDTNKKLTQIIMLKILLNELHNS
jgi:hypothetical protein